MGCWQFAVETRKYRTLRPAISGLRISGDPLSYD